MNISKGTFLQNYLNASPVLPRFLTLHLQNSDSMCWTMKPLLDFPNTCCCSCCILYHCCCFHCTCFRFLFWSCFSHFHLTPRGILVPVIAHGFWLSLFYTIILSWTEINYSYSNQIVIISFVSDASNEKFWPSCSYSIRWWLQRRKYSVFLFVQLPLMMLTIPFLKFFA